jgi:hypothetical protein
MDYAYRMIERQQYEERVRWLHSLYGASNPRHEPGRVKRLLNRLLYVVGRSLVSLGERMQQPRKDIPAAFPSLK